MTIATPLTVHSSASSSPTDIEVAIVGAGPYGLSIAAHLKALQVPFRIFGRLMDSWVAHMPKGMLLKSDGFASNICDPQRQLTLKNFCAQQGIEYGDTMIPVRLDTFCAYGRTFKEQFVPELEDRDVVAVDMAPDGFRLQLDDGQTLMARRVILAVGISHFQYVPQELAHLQPQFLSHSSRHRDLEPFKGRRVAVIGAGASALDISYLLRESGANVELIARSPQLQFHTKPTSPHRSLWQRMRHPRSGLGPGWRTRIITDAPLLFRHLPEQTRLRVVRRVPYVAGGWFARDKVMNGMPLHLGQTLLRCEVRSNEVHIYLRDAAGAERQIVTEHVIAATGYRPNINRLNFLSREIQSRMRCLENAPILSSGFESSIPGLYFVGPAATYTFGPLMRFAFGAGFSSRRIAKVIGRAHFAESARRA